jgi:hypothetical protein
MGSRQKAVNVLTQCWIDGSPTRTGSVKFERVAAEMTLLFPTLACLAKITELLRPDHQENGLTGDPAIHHGVITNCQKCFDGFLAGAHFLDDREAVTNFLLQDVSVGHNETKCKRKFVTGLC